MVVPVVATAAPVIPPAPVKVAEEVLTNEIVPTDIPVEVVTSSGEKVAAEVVEVATPEKVEVVSEIANDVVPEGEALETAASEIIVAQAPIVAATPVATVPESPVAAVAAAPVKATSEEEEGLIEGIVNTLILEDGDGKLIKFSVELVVE